jgi:stage II sporulation protein M
MISLGVGGVIGAKQADIYVLPAQAFDLSNLEDGFVQGVEGFETIRFFSIGGIGAVWLQNLRAIALATILGLFTFGVIGILVFMLPFVLIGYFVATAANIGISPWIFMTAFVLPHGIFEIPAIILAGGAALRIGATLTTPARDRTMSEALLESFADWARVMVALVIPLLLVAAIFEIYITPQVAIRLLGH